MMSDKGLGVGTKLNIIEKVQACWVLLILLQLWPVLRIQRRVERQNLETTRIGDFFVEREETLLLSLIDPPGLLITRQLFSE